MSVPILDASAELAICQRMVADLEDYLKSDVLYWHVSEPNPLGRHMPQLTIGALWEAMVRAQAAHADEQAEHAEGPRWGVAADGEGRREPRRVGCREDDGCHDCARAHSWRYLDHQALEDEGRCGALRPPEDKVGMEITFAGAAQTVTGSQHLLRINGHRLLLECGLFQGRRADTYAANRNFPFEPRALDAVILSHAHIDHCGNLPNLVRQGFEGPIHATHSTVHLTDLTLRDSGHIQESDIEFLNKKRARKGLPPVEPLYTAADAEAVSKQLDDAGLRPGAAAGAVGAHGHPKMR